jgi:ligand-binding sensor domain-containing protein
MAAPASPDPRHRFPPEIIAQGVLLYVRLLAADSRGHVWVATYNGGVYRWDGTRWQGWSAADGAPVGTMYALTWHGNALWAAGHADDRVYRWNKDSWTALHVPGLWADVRGLQFTPDGALWLATGDGLLRYTP